MPDRLVSRLVRRWVADGRIAVVTGEVQKNLSQAPLARCQVCIGVSAGNIPRVGPDDVAVGERVHGRDLVHVGRAVCPT